MKTTRVTVFSFSPNGTTLEIAKAVTETFPKELVEEIDLTTFENRWKLYQFVRDELIVLALPVYYGRLPLVSDEIFNHLSSNGSAAIGVVTYAYDAGKALEEMNSRLTSRGFSVCGLAAFASEYPFDRALGENRPNAADIKEACGFGKTVFEKVSRAFEPNYAVVPYAKLEDLRRTVQRPGKPSIVAASCTRCGLCAQGCPVYAINPHDPTETDSFRCILCGRCIDRCPTGSRLPPNALKDTALVARATHLEPLPNMIHI